MMSKKSVILLIFILITSIISCILLYSIKPFLTSNGFSVPNIKKAQKILDNNYNSLSNISDFMIKKDCNYIRWDAISKNEIICDGYKIEIAALNLQESINILYQKKFRHIVKQDNYISFTIWTSLDSSCSLLYCPQGEPHILENGKTELYKLSKDNWYFHVHVGD